MTRDEFANAYASRSNVSVRRLLQLGMRFVECGCGNGDCLGWQATVAKNNPFLTPAQRERADRWADEYLDACDGPRDA